MVFLKGNIFYNQHLHSDLAVNGNVWKHLANSLPNTVLNLYDSTSTVKQSHQKTLLKTRAFSELIFLKI